MTSSALRAPPLTLLGRYVAKPQLPALGFGQCAVLVALRRPH